MTKNEAYNMMLNGHAVTHKAFRDGDFLFMDENHIIRDEMGDEFETSWDVQSGDMWETNWYVYKNKKNIDAARKLAEENIEENPDSIKYIEGNNFKELEYRKAIAIEPIESKINRSFDPLALPESEQELISSSEVSEVETMYEEIAEDKNKKIDKMRFKDIVDSYFSNNRFLAAGVFITWVLSMFFTVNFIYDNNFVISEKALIGLLISILINFIIVYLLLFVAYYIDIRLVEWINRKEEF